MIDVLKFADHISNKLGVNDAAKYAFQCGYLAGILEDLILRVPEVRETIESQARKYNYVETV